MWTDWIIFLSSSKIAESHLGRSLSMWKWIQNENPSTSPLPINDWWPVEMLQTKQSKLISSLQYYLVPVRGVESWHLNRMIRLCCKYIRDVFSQDFCSPSLAPLATISLTTIRDSLVVWEMCAELLQTSMLQKVSPLKGPRCFWTWGISEEN